MDPKLFPSDRSALKIYSGYWKYKFEQLAHTDILKKISRDKRPEWTAECFPNFSNFNILELGPADGYNTYQLEKLAPGAITAIEGNKDAFLRCLILKNYLSMRAKFVYGDFVEYLRYCVERAIVYDLIYASGVLYHMQQPIEFLADLCKASRRLFVWTHFFDREKVLLVPEEKEQFVSDDPIRKTYAGTEYKLYKKVYASRFVESPGFIGGINNYCLWMEKVDTPTAKSTLDS